jgi:hypothetical protein
MIIENVKISIEVLGGEKIEDVIKKSLALLSEFKLNEEAIMKSYVGFRFNGVEMYVHQNDKAEDLLDYYNLRLRCNEEIKR